MKFLDVLEFSKIRIFRNKKNLFMILQFIICSLLLLIAFSFKSNFSNLIVNTLSRNIGFRSFNVVVKVDEPDLGITELSNIENVVSVYSSKYDNYSVDTSFKNNSLDGNIEFLYGEEKILPDLVAGRSINDNDTGVAICPANFLPSSQAADLFINQDYFLKGINLLDTNFQAYYYSYSYKNDILVKEKSYTKDFKIVGAYDSEKSMNPANSCFISKKDMVQMKNMVIIEDPNSYFNLVVVVDSIQNVPIVKQEIMNKNFLDASVRSEIDKKTIDIILLFCDLIISIILFVVIVLSFSYIKKKQLYDKKYFGILRANGFTKTQVLKLEIIEQFILNLVSCFLGMILFLVIFIIIKNLFLNNYVFIRSNLNLSFNCFIYTFVIVVLLVTIIDIIFIIKSNTEKIVKMIKGDL